MKKFILIFFIISGCASDEKDYSKFAKLQVFNKNFIFTIDENLKTLKSSKISPESGLMSVFEMRLLKKILVEKNVCIKSGKPVFKILSKQEKIYDVTFSHLIDQNYNANSIAPKTYYGECQI